MMIHIGSNFCTVPSTIPSPLGHVKDRVKDRIFMLKFHVNVFRISLRLNYMMDLVPFWYHNRYWSKLFYSTIITHDPDLEVAIKDLELYVKVFLKVFKTPLFPNLITYWSKFLPSSILFLLVILRSRSQSFQYFHVKILRQSF